MNAQYSIGPLSRVPDENIESLLNAAFGTDRHNRTAYKVRAGMDWLPDLSFAATAADDRLLGLIQCWPVTLFSDDGAQLDMIMVGPVAVSPTHQGAGIGLSLMRAAMRVAETHPAFAILPMMMIGDYEYYRRWNFTADYTGGWRLDGPFEQNRLLMRNPIVLGKPTTGVVGPRPAR